MGLTLITPATAQIVTLVEVQRHARQLDNQFDDLLTDHIVTAQGQVEQLLGRCLAPQVWRLTIDAFSPAIMLPKGPVTAVQSVTYLDQLGAQQTASSSLYTLDLTSDPQWLVLNAGASWPDTLEGVNAVQVDFTAGYAVATDPVFVAARAAVRALAVSWFESGEVGTVPESVRSLLFPHTRHGF